MDVDMKSLKRGRPGATVLGLGLVRLLTPCYSTEHEGEHRTENCYDECRELRGLQVGQAGDRMGVIDRVCPSECRGWLRRLLERR
jgi:hypothetical protein